MSAVTNQQRTFDFDPRLQLPNNIIIAGATQSGKTHLLMELLKAADRIFNPIPERIVFFYASYQDMYTDVQVELRERYKIDCVFIKASQCTLEEIVELCAGALSLVVFDDATVETSTSDVIAKACMNLRHERISIVLLQHTLYPRTRQSALINCNVKYIFVMSCVRMRQQVNTLASQLQMTQLMKAAYRDVTDKMGQYAYLMIDLTNRTPTFLRLRTNVLHPPSYVYVPKLS